MRRHIGRHIAREIIDHWAPEQLDRRREQIRAKLPPRSRRVGVCALPDAEIWLYLAIQKRQKELGILPFRRSA